MRPVDRGPIPLDGTGVALVFSHYRDARDPLIRHIGDYCSYCETALNSSIDVEHVRPKRHNPALERSWDNFLLGCDYCNPIKGATDVVLADYYWPDSDNTFRAFDYAVDQPPQIAGGLTRPQRVIAERTLQLTGLDRIPGHPQFSSRDRRWSKRKEVWGVALLSLDNLARQNTEETRRQIIFTAVSRGFFSIWMSVFQADADMLRRFVQAFAGTAKNCFDDRGNPIPRPGGAI